MLLPFGQSHEDAQELVTSGVVLETVGLGAEPAPGSEGGNDGVALASDVGVAFVGAGVHAGQEPFGTGELGLEPGWVDGAVSADREQVIPDIEELDPA